MRGYNKERKKDICNEQIKRKIKISQKRGILQFYRKRVYNKDIEEKKIAQRDTKYVVKSQQKRDR